MAEAILTLTALAAWLRDQHWSEFAQSLADHYARTGTLTPRQEAAARSMHAKVSARSARSARREFTVGQVLRTDRPHVWVRVVRSQNGYLYGKGIDLRTGLKLVERGLLRRATTEVTADEARLFGLVHQSCCFCSRPLSDDPSEFAGYGPVCAQQRGLPWGEVWTDAAARDEDVADAKARLRAIADVEEVMAG